MNIHKEDRVHHNTPQSNKLHLTTYNTIMDFDKFPKKKVIKDKISPEPVGNQSFEIIEDSAMEQFRLKDL
jgi:hypothetical protein